MNNTMSREAELVEQIDMALDLIVLAFLELERMIAPQAHAVTPEGVVLI